MRRKPPGATKFQLIDRGTIKTLPGELIGCGAINCSTVARKPPGVTKFQNAPRRIDPLWGDQLIHRGTIKTLAGRIDRLWGDQLIHRGPQAARRYEVSNRSLGELIDCGAQAARRYEVSIDPPWHASRQALRSFKCPTSDSLRSPRPDETKKRPPQEAAFSIDSVLALTG